MNRHTDYGVHQSCFNRSWISTYARVECDAIAGVRGKLRLVLQRIQFQREIDLVIFRHYPQL